jgi:hypothetical protein
MRVPKLSIPNGMICDLEDLELSEGNPKEQALQNRENNAKWYWYCSILFMTTSFFPSLKMNACGTKRCTSCQMKVHHISFSKKENRFFRICKTTFKQEIGRF